MSLGSIIWSFRLEQEGIFTGMIYRTVEVFSYIVLKLLLLNPFCVYDSQYPTQKASIFKRNIVQLSDQPNSASSNPLYKAHIVKQLSYSQGHAELQPLMNGSSSCAVLMENPDLHGHSESLPLMHDSSSCAEILLARSFGITTAYAWLIQLCSSHRPQTCRDIQNHNR